MFEEYLVKLKQQVDEGLDINDAILNLHNSGFTIVESMKAVVGAFDMPLSEAKVIVSRHPIWKEVVKASEALHDDLLKEIK